MKRMDLRSRIIASRLSRCLLSCVFIFLFPVCSAAAPYISADTPLPGDEEWRVMAGERPAGSRESDASDGLPRQETVKVVLGNIRDAPSTAASIVGTVDRYRTVTLLYRREDWYRVRLSDGTLGWAHQSLFRETVGGDAQKGATVKVVLGNVRESPTIRAAVISKIARDQRVSIIDERGNWYRIRTSAGKTGWAHRSLFRPAEEDVPAPEVRKTLTGTILEAPDAQSTVIDTVEGQPAAVVEERDDWLRVRLADGRLGWTRRSASSRPSRARETDEASQQGDSAHRIKFIRVDIARDGEERVLFLLDGYFPPKTFVMEGETLRVVCDFPDTSLAPGIGRVVPVEGRLIRQIRTSQYLGDHQKVRAVLDLAPKKQYEVNQFFFQGQNVYSVVVREK